MLDAYLDPVPIDPLGVVDLHFMTQVEGDFPFLPQYFRNGDIVQSQGGLLYNFQPLPPTFPVIGFELHNVQHNCPDIGCITIVGLSQGNPISEATNQMTGGGSQETIMLPLPPQGMLYDEVIVFSLDMITFGVWDVVIVDP